MWTTTGRIIGGVAVDRGVECEAEGGDAVHRPATTEAARMSMRETVRMIVVRSAAELDASWLDDDASQGEGLTRVAVEPSMRKMVVTDMRMRGVVVRGVEDRKVMEVELT